VSSASIKGERTGILRGDDAKLARKSVSADEVEWAMLVSPLHEPPKEGGSEDFPLGKTGHKGRERSEPLQHGFCGGGGFGGVGGKVKSGVMRSIGISF